MGLPHTYDMDQSAAVHQQYQQGVHVCTTCMVPHYNIIMVRETL